MIESHHKVLADDEILSPKTLYFEYILLMIVH